MTRCSACKGRGWLLAYDWDYKGGQQVVQRCDACMRFSTDEKAMAHVVKMAKRAERAQ
jgi:hypothetical protein